MTARPVLQQYDRYDILRALAIKGMRPSRNGMRHGFVLWIGHLGIREVYGRV